MLFFFSFAHFFALSSIVAPKVSTFSCRCMFGRFSLLFAQCYMLEQIRFAKKITTKQTSYHLNQFFELEFYVCFGLIFLIAIFSGDDFMTKLRTTLSSAARNVSLYARNRL